MRRQALQSHSEPIVALALNCSGSLLAVGSQSGTNVKIYSTNNCEMLRKVTRGSTHCGIKHLVFSQTSHLLSLTS